MGVQGFKVESNPPSFCGRQGGESGLLFESQMYHMFSTFYRKLINHKQQWRLQAVYTGKTKLGLSRKMCCLRYWWSPNMIVCASTPQVGMPSRI